MSTMPLTHPSPANPSTGARLVAADGRELPLRSVELESEAGGGLAATIVRQVFHNPHAVPMHVSYQLPLPADGAVIDFRFTLDDRTIVGRVEKKADARKAFEDAVLEGRTAALLEQDRSSLFHQELGNVPAGAEISCEITIEHLLVWRADRWEWRFPTVVAPRFLGTPGQTPDAERVTVSVLDGEAPVRCGLSLRITDAGAGPAESTSHVVANDGDAWSLAADARLDRDVVVRWPVSTRKVGTDIEVARPAGDPLAYAMLTVVPPIPESRPAPVPRDLILLLDVSGSMGGRPVEQLKAFSRALVRTLGPADQLQMIRFASSQQRWKAHSAPVDARNKADALAWIETLRAGGGTYMHEAIIAALQPLRREAQRQVVLVTDGLIGFETEVIGAIRNALPANSRVHCIGVGSSVNRSLLGPAARAGAGLEIVVGLDEPVEPGVAELLARTDAPLVVDLSLQGAVLREVAPARMPDLFAGAPARLALAVDPAGGPLTLRGRSAEGAWSVTVNVPAAAEASGRRVMATRFARERIEDLELEAAGSPSAEIDRGIEALALRHRIASRLTSWVAETKERTVDPSSPTQRVNVPQQLPYGMSAEGLGLRPGLPAAQSLAMAPPAPAPASAPRRMVRRTEASKSVRKAKRRSRGVLRSLFEGFAGGPPEPEVEAAAEEARPMAADDPAPTPGDARSSGVLRALIKAIVRAFRDGKLVLEITTTAQTPWFPGDEVELHLPDGSVVNAEVLPGTTAAATVHAGATLRLVVAWVGARPLQVHTSNLILEL